VCFWFENARSMIEAGRCRRAGFVATNSIRKNTNLPVLHRIADTTRIFAAWPEEKWDIEGAAVDVSLICFGDAGDELAILDGEPVTQIYPDLTAGLNLTLAKPLGQNAGAAMLGIQKSGPFDVPGTVAREWMAQPENINGQPNSAVLKPYWNGDDVTGRPRDMWLIDLPLGLSEDEASRYELPHRHLASTPDEDGLTVQQLRKALGERAHDRWWEPHWPRPRMRRAVQAISRYIVTPETSEHRLFLWLSYPTLPDKNLIVIPRDDDLMFGLLHSRFHEVWSLRKGSDLQNRPRYTHTSTFATFPFPDGMTPDISSADAMSHSAAEEIAAAAAELDQLRLAWLWPASLYREEAEVTADLPPRRVPVDERAAAALRGRTLTGLYNEPPEWLTRAHARLDSAVACAYGFEGPLEDTAILESLLELNLMRSG
jgi:hypothetical protein